MKSGEVRTRTGKVTVPSSGITDWLEALSESRASPAAGSAAAITGALGVTLLIKLARLTRPGEIPDYDQLLGRLLAARDHLMALADADASAITAWLRTRQLLIGDPARQAALQALVDTPLEAAELCQTIRLEAESLLERGYPPALPDGEVGIQLLEACQRALCFLILVNLPTLADTAFSEAAHTRLEKLG